MDENASDYLKVIQAEIKKLNSYLKILLFCVAAVTIALVAEVWRHW